MTRVLAATPPWFADNLTQISLGTLVVVVALVIRLVQKMLLRTALLTLIALAALLIYANRDALQVCAKTCECDLAGRRVTVPTCQTDRHL